jgi:hypothetical protein
MPHHTEGHDTVPLRLPRRHLTCSARRLHWLARAIAVTGLACAPVAAAALPAFAATANPPPGSHPSGQGARPKTPPVPPPVRSSASVIAADLLQDGAISAGALIALLVPITWYGSLTRRREREARSGGRDLAGSGADQAADPLADYFGPRAARPAPGPPGRVEPRFQPRPALAGRSTLSPGFAAGPMLPAPHPAAAPRPATPPVRAPIARAVPGEEAPGRHAGTRGPSAPAATPRDTPAYPGRPAYSAAPDAWPGAADRYGDTRSGTGIAAAGMEGAGSTGATAPTLRRAQVSGSPPWEPARRPTTSELPWTAPFGPQGPGLAGPPGLVGRPGGQGQRQPAESGQEGGARYPVAAGETTPPAPRSVFDPQPGQQEKTQADAGRRQRGDTGSRPIYTWNPGGESA